VCPNCGGGFEKRPTRPKGQLKKNPTKKEKLLKPVDLEKFVTLRDKLKNVNPRER
jgi:hypothetical protein